MQNHRGESVDAVKFVKQLDPDQEVDVRTLKPGDVLKVATKNSLYVFERGGTRWHAHGGVLGDTPKLVSIHGSTFGGTMLKIGHAVVGAFLEFSAGEKVWQTSEIRAVEVTRKVEE